MPITTSAQKALRQSARRRIRNLARKEAVKTAVKLYKKLIARKKLGEATDELRKVFKALDKAAKTGVLHKNKASRLKSQFAKQITKITKS